MKKTLFLALITCLTLASCTKKSNVQPTPQKPPTESIPTLSVTTFAGGGSQSSLDGTGANAQFYQIVKLTSDKAGNVYVIEAVNTSTNLFFKIRKVTPGGVTSTLFNGGAETFVNNKPVEKSKVYRVIDIAADPNGNLFVLANLTDYSTSNNAPLDYYQEVGIYKLNTSNGSLNKVSVSASNTNFYPTPAAAYNNVNTIAVDASGNIYGAYSPGNATGIPSGGKIYKINASGGTLLADVGNAYPSSLYAEGNGNVYVNTSTSIIKITGTQQTNTFYTFPNLDKVNPEILLGNQSGTLYEYGGLYNAAKELKGTGFYSLKADGTIGSTGIINNAPNNIFGSVTDVSGNIYYAVHQSTGGYAIQKVRLK
jgi:hypothetical protein